MFNYKNIYIDDWYSIIGPKEKSDGNLKKYNLALSDYYFNEKTIEKAEVRMQKFVLNYFKSSKIDVVCASDLMDQLIVSNLMAEEEDIPFLGVYNACASFASGVISIANMIQSKGVKRGVYITSSHNLSAEKQFRFPIEYGAVKPKRSTFTATGAVGVSLNNTSGKIKIISATLGKVKDSYVKDAFNMGGVMAISAIATFKEHLKNRCKSEEDYDLICKNPSYEKPYVLLYLLIMPKDVDLYVQRIRQLYPNCLIVSIPGSSYVKKIGDVECSDIGPKEFIGLIKHSEAVFTSSFHGTVFSILYEKKFASYLPQHTGGRIRNLLKSFDLTERIVDAPDALKILPEPIDYTFTKAIRVQEKRNADAYLDTILADAYERNKDGNG